MIPKLCVSLKTEETLIQCKYRKPTVYLHVHVHLTRKEEEIQQTLRITSTAAATINLILFNCTHKLHILLLFT